MHSENRVHREEMLRWAVLAGDENAWRVWCLEAFDELDRFIIWRCGGQRDEADEIVQETWLTAGRQDRPAVGRRLADRHEPRRCTGGDRRRDLPAAMDDRTVFPLLQAHLGLPAPLEHVPAGSGDSGLLRHHRLPLVGPLAPAASRPCGPSRWSASTCRAGPTRRNCSRI
jgi:hypothetical protein